MIDISSFLIGVVCTLFTIFGIEPFTKWIKKTVTRILHTYKKPNNKRHK